MTAHGDALIRDCQTHGCLNSVSIVPNGSLEEAVAALRPSGLKLAVHLNLVEGKAQTYRENAMENMMLRFGIGYNTLLNTSTGHIAEMIIKGSNNGVLEMEKVLAHNEEFAGNACRSLAKELIEMENANIRTLKEYL